MEQKYLRVGDKVTVKWESGGKWKSGGVIPEGIVRSINRKNLTCVVQWLDEKGQVEFKTTAKFLNILPPF